MADKAKTILDYVKSNTPKYGINNQEIAGSGPGGAAATGRLSARTAADVNNWNRANNPSRVGLDSERIKEGDRFDKAKRAIDQMRQITKIYNDAATSIKNKKPQLKLNNTRSDYNI